MLKKMKQFWGNKKLPEFLNTRIGFFSLIVLLLWLKNIFSYLIEFNLGIENGLEYFILFINPIATTLFLMSIALYVRRKKPAYITMMIIYSLMTLLLFSNVVYYREFTDFITINTMLGVGKVASGLGESALRLFRPYDFIYLIDIFMLVIGLACKKIKMDDRPIRARMALAMSTLSILVFSGNLFLAETVRPQLLTRTFSRDYLVKYLGLNAFTVYDGVTTYQTNQVRAEASANDLDEVADYVDNHYAAPNDDLFGIAKGKNVIYIHLESFQQFLIDYELEDETGTRHEVTPFINELYHSNSTFSFSNFFHQVGGGKTSDSETLFENSLFGLSQGSLFSQLGGKNTFQAAPAILNQTQGYTSAVFHGNAGNFWNRNETYKRFGFDYFFDAAYYDVNEENSFQYGLHDKPFFQQSAQYLERLQQPFYTKFLAVSNHYPYSTFKDDNAGFPLADTKDETINGYFATANYLDTAVNEFFNYLKESGLYENSVIILYGDHYGISNSRNKDLADLIDGRSSATWTDYDNAQMQRVPYMIHIPGQTNGYENPTFGGQVDALPTLLHLLGIDSKPYMLLGQDLFSADNEQVVAFRNGNFMTANYTYIGGTIYDNRTGFIVSTPSEALTAQIEEWRKKVEMQLSVSDQINNGDLLRFHDYNDFKTIDPDSFSYLKQMEQIAKKEKALGKDSTSIYSKNENQTTTDLYQSKTYREYHPEIPSDTPPESDSEEPTE